MLEISKFAKKKYAIYVCAWVQACCGVFIFIPSNIIVY